MSHTLDPAPVPESLPARPARPFPGTTQGVGSLFRAAVAGKQPGTGVSPLFSVTLTGFQIKSVRCQAAAILANRFVKTAARYILRRDEFEYRTGTGVAVANPVKSPPFHCPAVSVMASSARLRWRQLPALHHERYRRGRSADPPPGGRRENKIGPLFSLKAGVGYISQRISSPNTCASRV